MKRWILIALAAAFSLFLPFIFKDDYYRYLFVMMGINIILVSSLDILVGYTGSISMAHAAFWGVGAYGSALLAIHYHVGLIGGLFVSILVSMIFGILIGYPSLRLKGHYFVIVTFIFGIIIEILLRNLVQITRGPMGLPGIPPARLEIPGLLKIVFSSTLSYYYLVLVFVFIILMLKVRLIHSKMGRALISIREDEILAQSVGVNTAFYKVLTFAISSSFAGIAGTLYSHFISFIGPETFSFFKSFELFVMNLVGGKATLVGPILGSCALILLEEWAKIFSPAIARVVYGIILILFIIYMPLGIAGLISKLKTKVMGKRGHEIT
jgi:branched-chain amino acid transport system permease protein